jgi:hypothetical protein
LNGNLTYYTKIKGKSTITNDKKITLIDIKEMDISFKNLSKMQTVKLIENQIDLAIIND